MNSKQQYARRQGRVSARRRNLLHTCDILYTDTKSFLQSSFFQRQPFYIEIGFGMGEHFISSAYENPHVVHVGIELYTCGVASVLSDSQKYELTNVAILQTDANTAISQLPNSCAQNVQIYYPDPWPKKRHKKRRLVTHDFLTHCYRTLNQTGTLDFISDFEDYYHASCQTLAKILSINDTLDCNVTASVNTKFSRRAQEEGRDSYRWLCTKQIA